MSYRSTEKISTRDKRIRHRFISLTYKKKKIGSKENFIFFCRRRLLSFRSFRDLATECLISETADDEMEKKKSIGDQFGESHATVPLGSDFQDCNSFQNSKGDFIDKKGAAWCSGLINFEDFDSQGFFQDMNPTGRGSGIGLRLPGPQKFLGHVFQDWQDMDSGVAE
ncbi:unnamed protein product [Caenorhabditis nigoni]